MYKVKLRKNNLEKRRVRIRSRIKGTADRPRLSVFRSNKYIYAQLIDDVSGKTLIYAGPEAKDTKNKLTKSDSAREIGKNLAKKALKENIKQAAFDRKGYKFHGRVKLLAEAAREEGLKI